MALRRLVLALARLGGLPAPVAGSARLLARFKDAAGHNSANRVTYGSIQRTYPLPELIQVRNTGDGESVLSFGVGPARKTALHVHLLRQPSRVAVDGQTQYRTCRRPRVLHGQPPVRRRS